VFAVGDPDEIVKQVSLELEAHGVDFVFKSQKGKVCVTQDLMILERARIILHWNLSTSLEESDTSPNLLHDLELPDCQIARL
jgi:hypothetical protein